MYKVTKRIEIAGCHSLRLNYSSPCSNLHGHNWIVHVEVEGEDLDENGMLVDFKHIKEVVNQLDHAHLNDIIPTNPTAENLCAWITKEVQARLNEHWKSDPMGTPSVVKVQVQESEGNVACYTTQ